ARMYGRGELVRWRSEGSLEFVGREESQIKIRGHRMEIAEVECRLSEHRAVRDAAVLAQPGPDGEPRLVAFIVAREGEDASHATLRQYLRTRVPEYMVPAGWVEVEAL